MIPKIVRRITSTSQPTTIDQVKFLRRLSGEYFYCINCQLAICKEVATSVAITCYYGNKQVALGMAGKCDKRLPIKEG